MIVLALGFALSSVAHADVKYTVVGKYVTQENSPGSSSKLPQITDTNFVALHKSRKDSVRRKGAYTSKETTIIRCDLHQEFQIDDNLKIYTVSPLARNGFRIQPLESELKKIHRSGKIATHWTLKEIAPEKVNGFDTKCYLMTMHTQYSGCTGNQKEDSEEQVWVTHVQGYNLCGASQVIQPSFTEIEETAGGKCKITYENTGDIKKIGQIFSSELIVREKTPVNGNIEERDVTSLLQTKLKNNLFDVPVSYRKVSSGEYQKLRTHAMLSAIQK